MDDQIDHQEHTAEDKRRREEQMAESVDAAVATEITPTPSRLDNLPIVNAGGVAWHPYGVCSMNVLRRAGGQCNNGGPSSKHDRIRILVYRSTTLSASNLPSYEHAKEICKEIDRKIGPITDDVFIAARYSISYGPVARMIDPSIPWSMAGGNYAETSNGIEHRLLGCEHPISIHDRVEQ